MIIGVVKEPDKEDRVSLLSDEVKKLTTQGIQVWVENGAGEKAFCLDDAYKKAGAILKTRKELLINADILISIHRIELPKDLKSKVLIGIYQPLYDVSQIEHLAIDGHVVFSMDMLPRTTRAQSMDVLSSQSNVAGYGAFILAASNYPRYVPMLMTAAGSIKPATLLVLGAGVAGLQAIATGHRLGAVVQAFDTRPAVKEEVESLGAKFIEVEGAQDASKAKGYAVEQTEAFQEKQKAKIASCIQKADIVITTAQIFGGKAPILVTKEMIETMEPGSVIVDLAASTGGNTALTKDATKIVTPTNQVTIIGDSNIPSKFPYDSSKLYGRNITNFLKLITTDKGDLNLDFSDELVSGTCITKDGKIVNERVNKLLEVTV